MSARRRRGVAPPLGFLVLAVILGACGEANSPEGDQFYFPVYESEPSEPSSLAVVEGKASILSGTCLVVESSGVRYLLIWPDDFALDSSNEPIQVLNAQGDVIFRVGEDVALVGGEREPGSEDAWSQAPPPACDGTNYWMVADSTAAIGS